MPRRMFFLFIALLAGSKVFAQSYIGQRTTINFEKQRYKAGTQNWKIRQDAQGRMYFANNEGVLVFDGTYWQLYPLPNKTIVRSIEFGPDNRLYIGGQDEIGYFSPDKNGQLVYSSIKNLLADADQKFSDVWDIVHYNGDIFFRTTYKIFRYNGNKVTTFPTQASWLFLGTHNHQLLAQEREQGILVFKDNKWQPYLPKDQLPDGFFITAATSYEKDTTLLSTSKNGIYLLANNKISELKLSGLPVDSHQYFSGCIDIGEGNFLLSTYTNGFYQANKKGVISENFSKNEGLQNSNVRSIFMDNNHNIWLGLDNGIDFIAYNSAVKHINPVLFNDGGGFSMAKFQNNLFFALSTGIYQLPLTREKDLSFSKNNFAAVSEGQCWHIGVANNQLLAGKEDGLYRINGGKAEPIEKSTGYWIFKPLKIDTSNAYMAAGNYNGVRLFEYKNNNLFDKGSISSYRESARYLAVDSSNNIWISHPYRGVYKINPADSSVKIYTSEQGLPSTLNNHIFKVKNRVVAATERGVYEYDPKTSRFQQSAYFYPVFGNTSLRYLKEDPSGNIWFVSEKNIGVADYSSSKPVLIYLPELKNKILSGFENVYPIDMNNVFVGGEKGFYHVNYEKYKQHIQPLLVYIRKIKTIAEHDSLLFGGYYADGGETQKGKARQGLRYHWNSLHFEYSSPLIEKESSVEYSYFLDGFDKEWSPWSGKTEKDYTNLPAGSYTFKIKARNHINNESSVSTYSFSILPPWYQTLWAYVGYLILSIVILYIFYTLQEKKHAKKQLKQLATERQKHEEEQRRLSYLHQLELEVSEKEVVKLRNEKLESEIEFKNSELASAAMNLVQKKEFLLKVKEELQQLNKSGRDMVETAELKKILRILSEEKQLNEEWEQFSIHFNRVQGDFLNIIKEKYPNLKPHELKLCAYLRMNLSSKEIAQLMSISVRGVEISRYRLRKKLEIPTDINLFQFLFDLHRDKISV